MTPNWVPAIAAVTLLAGCGAANAAPHIGCTDAPAVIVDIINQSFTNGEQLVDAQAVDAPQDMTYIGGNIQALDGERVSSSDVWLVQHGAVFALSSDARRRTLLPDGRDFASAGDEYGTAVQECVHVGGE